MTPAFQKLKSFSIGLCIAGITALVTATPPLSRGPCAGMCAQCGGCGLAALPLVLWLAAKRWTPATKVQSLWHRTLLHPKRIIAAVTSPEDKVL